MDERLKQLNQILQEQISVHESLREDLRQELEDDGKLDGKLLMQLQHRKSHKANSLQHLEENRMAIVRELGSQWGVEADSLNLRQIIARAPKEQADVLSECHGTLLALVEEIQGLARQTSSNAQARLRAVEATLVAINDSVKSHATYSEAGKLNRKPPTFRETSV